MGEKMSALGAGEWLMLMVGTLMMGLGKGGLPGLGMVAIVVYATIFTPKASVGILLPVLIATDIMAVTVYRRHVEWRMLWRLLPWMCAGVLVGWWAFGRMGDVAVERFMGGTILVMLGIQLWRQWDARRAVGSGLGARLPHALWFRAVLGLFGGVATMMANAAGPVAQLYLLVMGLPKMTFVGTSAWCFFLLNLYKLPMQAQLGIVNFESLRVSLTLAPLGVLGALVAPQVVRRIPQVLFNRLVMLFIFAGGVKMLLF